MGRFGGIVDQVSCFFDRLPVDFPTARVCAINYETDPNLWRPIWYPSRQRSTLSMRAMKMIRILVEHDIGVNRPIIWVSFKSNQFRISIQWILRSTVVRIATNLLLFICKSGGSLEGRLVYQTNYCQCTRMQRILAVEIITCCVILFGATSRIAIGWTQFAIADAVHWNDWDSNQWVEKPCA